MSGRGAGDEEGPATTRVAVMGSRGPTPVMTTRPTMPDAIVFVDIDGESLDAGRGVERDPYAEDGGES